MIQFHRLLLDHGARTEGKGFSLLSECASEGRAEAVAALIRFGARVDGGVAGGGGSLHQGLVVLRERTPTVEAAAAGRPNCLKILARACMTHEKLTNFY